MTDPATIIKQAQHQADTLGRNPASLVIPNYPASLHVAALDLAKAIIPTIKPLSPLDDGSGTVMECADCHGEIGASECPECDVRSALDAYIDALSEERPA